MITHRRNKEVSITNDVPHTNKCTKCLHFIYNHENKTIFGETAGTWCKLCTYYTLFLTLLIIFFVLILFISWSTIDQYETPFFPKSNLVDGSQAAISSFPKDAHTSMISYNGVNSDDYKYFTDFIKRKLDHYTSEGVKVCESSIERMLKVYLSGYSVNSQYLHQIFSSDKNLNSKVGNLILDSRNESNIDDSLQKSNKIPCQFKISSLGPCSQHPYGFDRLEPCFYLKINKVLEWKPVPYNTFSVLPDKMPEDLKKKIVKTVVPKIWTHCEGTNEWDNTNFKDIKYYPEQNFDLNFFPYLKSRFYQSPLVAVQIIGLKSEFNFFNFIDQSMALYFKLYVQLFREYVNKYRLLPLAR